MARNSFLNSSVAADIDRRVTRILRDLGNPEPPLQLRLVREALKLDLEYYRKDDPGALHGKGVRNLFIVNEPGQPRWR